MEKKSAPQLAGQRAFRFSLGAWLLLGHGIPKIGHWIFGVETWGPHAAFVPKNFFSGLTAFIEVMSPLLIVCGLRIKWNAVVVASVLLVSAFSYPFPWLHERVVIEGGKVPFAIILSKEIHIVYALAYLSLLFFAVDEKFTRGRRRYR